LTAPPPPKGGEEAAREEAPACVDAGVVKRSGIPYSGAASATNAT
jgi:hypothetical protein